MYKIYIVPIVREMTAIWLVWLRAHGQIWRPHAQNL